MADLSVRISSLVYHYPESTHGLEDFTLDVPCGETWGLIGPNGAGKSTLLLLLDGLLKPMSGDIEVFGQSMKQNGSVDSVRRRMGIVFQNADDQVFCPTVFEDVVFGPLNHGLSNDEAHDLAHEALSKVGLDGYESRVPQHLSGGEKRRVAIATVLAMRPELILYDEPTTGLDPKGREELIAILGQTDCTQIIATHDFEMVLKVCDKVALLSKGCCVKTGTPEEILFDKELLDAHDLVQPSWLPYLKGIREAP
ncbi:MAG: energy-coupling factor ABC transporter ATP-binding protein [Candidatus Omnitrophica bacterium]|nr:energy-coupling factor ABC transporter ATP-binding protein [Candidatus Omnitrophota bacterium]